MHNYCQSNSFKFYSQTNKMCIKKQKTRTLFYGIYSYYLFRSIQDIFLILCLTVCPSVHSLTYMWVVYWRKVIEVTVSPFLSINRISTEIFCQLSKLLLLSTDLQSVIEGNIDLTFSNYWLQIKYHYTHLLCLIPGEFIVPMTHLKIKT